MSEEKCSQDIGTVDWSEDLCTRVHQMRHLLMNGMSESIWREDPEHTMAILGLFRDGLKVKIDGVLGLGIRTWFEDQDQEEVDLVAMLAVSSIFMDILARDMAEYLPEQYSVLFGSLNNLDKIKSTAMKGNVN